MSGNVSFGPQSGAGRAEARDTAAVYLAQSPASRAVQLELREAIASTGPVLLIGKAGTGKQTIARLIHQFCGATALPFTVLDPASLDAKQRLPDFGYLCPVESLSHAQQASLRNRIGLGRLIVSTRLEPGSRAWQERLDPRLLKWCRMRIELPALGARVDDIDALVTRFLLRNASEETTGPIGGISEDALRCLQAYEWPGELDELEAVLREASQSVRGAQIELWDLPVRLRLRDASALSSSPLAPLSLASAERVAIARALRVTRGNRRQAARLLGVSESTLYRKLARQRSSGPTEFAE